MTGGGFDRSSQLASGYDYDTFAGLDALMSKLNLHEATLARHSMGTGEVIRYLGAYGSVGRAGSPRLADRAVPAGDNPEA